MKVIVPSLGSPGQAELALQEQGLAYETRPVDGNAGYGEMLAELWRQGHGFLLLEHDIIPAEGAVERLLRCRQPWCTHAYPGPQLFMSMGVLKLTASALRKTSDFPPMWAGAHWSNIDGVLIPALHSRLALHGHYPPFGHERFALPGQ